MFQDMPISNIIGINAAEIIFIIIVFVYFKKYMKVGKIVMEEFLIVYGFFLLIAYFIAIPYFLPFFDKNTFFFIDFLGLFIAAPVGIHIFNVYHPDVDFYEFLVIDYPRRRYKRRYYYVYTKNDDQYIIHFEFGDREKVWDFLKRMFGFRTKVVFTDNVLLYFKNEWNDELYFLDDLRIIRAPVKGYTYDEEGELIQVIKKRGIGFLKWTCHETILEADPVQATGMTELEFVVNYGRYLRLSRENAELTKRLILAEEMQESEVAKEVRRYLKYIKADEEELSLEFELEELQEKMRREKELLEREVNHDEEDMQIAEEAMVGVPGE